MERMLPFRRQGKAAAQDEAAIMALAEQAHEGLVTVFHAPAATGTNAPTGVNRAKDARDAHHDLEELLATLPPHVRQAVERLPADDRAGLLEIVLDLGRRPEARVPTFELSLSGDDVTPEDLE